MGVFIPSYEEAFGIQIIEAQSFKKVSLVFENSLRLNSNIKILNENSYKYSLNDFNKLLNWNEDGNRSLVYSSEDTYKSLEEAN